MKNTCYILQKKNHTDFLANPILVGQVISTLKAVQVSPNKAKGSLKTIQQIPNKPTVHPN